MYKTVLPFSLENAMCCVLCAAVCCLNFERGFSRGAGRQEEEGGWSAGDGSGELGKLRHGMEKLQAA